MFSKILPLTDESTEALDDDLPIVGIFAAESPHDLARISRPTS